MANEIKVIARKGQSLAVDVFQPDGAEREFGVGVIETARGRFYLGDCATIQSGDIEVIYNTVTGRLEGGVEYMGKTMVHSSVMVIRNA